ncbi:MAG: hypothetical protein AAGA56_14700 [Myxococcota bacterium]
MVRRRPWTWLFILYGGAGGACIVAEDGVVVRSELEGEVSGPYSPEPLPTSFGGNTGATTDTASTTPSTSGPMGGNGSDGDCDQPSEPDDRLEQATDLGRINDCDSSGSTLEGRLELDDVDWYTYRGEDNFGCVVDPARSLVADGPVRMCKYFSCLNGDAAEVQCEDGATPTTEAGLDGCCSNGGFQVEVECPSFDDDGIVYIRFDGATRSCTRYTLDYNY